MVEFYKKPILAILVLFAEFMNAQSSNPDVKIDVTTHTDSAMGANWMGNPLIWVIGALVLILIIALIARGSGNRD